VIFDVDPLEAGIQLCRSVPVEATFDVDILVRDVADLAGFNLTVGILQPWILNVVGCDVDLFLASAPGALITDLSDPLPDSDGSYVVAAVNFGPAPGASGSGVLVRLTLSTVGTGEVLLTMDEQALGDSSGNPIDFTFLGIAAVEVGQPCP
jgi:hypothetical protein